MCFYIIISARGSDDNLTADVSVERTSHALPYVVPSTPISRGWLCREGFSVEETRMLIGQPTRTPNPSETLPGLVCKQQSEVPGRHTGAFDAVLFVEARDDLLDLLQ